MYVPLKALMERIGFTEEEQKFFTDLSARIPEATRLRMDFLRERFIGKVKDKKSARPTVQSAQNRERY